MEDKPTINRQPHNGKKQLVKYISFITVISAVFLFIAVYISINKGPIFKLIAVADRYERNGEEGINNYSQRKIEFLPINIAKKSIMSKHSSSFPFPYFYDEDYRRLRNLVENTDKNTWYFIDYATSGKKWDCVKIRFNRKTNRMETLKLLENYELKDLFDGTERENHFVSVNSKEEALANDGEILNIRDKTSRMILEWPPPNDFWRCTGSALIGDDSFVLQWLGTKVMKNYLGIGTMKQGTQKFVEAGFAPGHSTYIFSFPISVDDSRENIAFLSLKDNINKDGYYSFEGQQLQLRTICLGDSSLNEIIDLPENLCLFPSNDRFRQTFLEWQPLKNSKIVALDNIPLKDPTKFKSAGIFLLDISQKKITRHIRTNFTTKSLRWSPDGKRIGILSWDGELFIYDVDKDSLEKVAEDRDYFDFFWTE